MPTRIDQNLHYPADAVAKILFHVHGVEPVFCDDFRHSEHGSWPARYGRHEITKNGDPPNSPSLGDTDGRALETNTDHLSVPNHADLNFGSADPFSTIHLFRSVTSNINTGERLGGKRDGGGPGYVSYGITDSADGDLKFGFFLDDGTDNANARANYYVDDGNPHTFIGTCDRDNDTSYAFNDGNAAIATTDISGIESIDNTADLGVGAEGDGDQRFKGDIGLFAAHPQWIPSEIAAYLHEILVNDRTRFAPALDRWVYGTPEDGLQRRLPDYLPSTTKRWYAAKRDPFQKKSGALTQLPDFSGTNFGTQRTDSAKPSADTDSSNRDGTRANFISFGGDDHISERNVTSDPSTLSGSFRIKQASGQSGTVAVWSHNDGGTADIALEYDAGNNRYQLSVVDSAGNTVTLTDTSSGIDPTAAFHSISFRFDESGDYVLRVNGTEVASDTTDLTGNNFSATKRQLGAKNGSSNATFDLKERCIADAPLTDGEFSTLEGGM